MRTGWLPWAAALLGLLSFLLVRESLTDDGYITLAYAKNLAVHGEWALVPGSVANSATSPLDVLLLGLLTFATRISGSAHPVFALGVLTALTSGALGWAWLRLTHRFRLAPWVALLGVVLVVANPFLLSATGLEVLLVPAILLWLVVFAAEGRPVLFGVAAALAVLTRLDLVVFVAVIGFATAGIRRHFWRAFATGIAVAAPWFLVSWFALGSFVPDTLVIKQAQSDLFGKWGYFTGPMMYFLIQPVAVVFTFAAALAGVVLLIAWAGVRFARRWDGFPALAPVAGLGAGGVLYYLVYSMLGVGPYHWYYVTPVVGIGMFAVLVAGVWLTEATERPAPHRGAPLAALGVVGVVVAGAVGVDLAQGVPWRSPVVFGNWASSTDYARVGRELGARLDGKSVAGPGEIGTLAYFCDCRILDVFSDRSQVAPLVQRRIAGASGVKSFALRLNYRWFDRTQPKRRPDYRLLYGEGPATGPDSWTVTSAAKGVGHFTLLPEG
ncbi:hypothetical protein [Amycolatopsis jiangsuensis]|uniref:4-amino-4-deoxy-L-arabinose transferase-like glycosyltransferase n=1 Tax=Amycolatopsis jiangsuensis TaxID=1181879 RepID=A0A840IM57_9PSEU|nr:hypothetical protein [Amycolatopsis jiangsuensis]MBB4683461.1 hypothetical protein [Amycolatopsis jiangsuensis]